MNNINITNIQKRRPRRSMLGTHRGYSIGFQFNDEPTQKLGDDDPNASTISVNISNLNRKPRKSMLGLRNIRRDSIFSMLPEPSLDESLNASMIPLKDDEATDVTSPLKKKLETIFSQETNDSFEEHETIMMANENEESVLATTLMDSTIVEMNNGIPAQPEDNSTLLDISVTKPETEDSALSDLIIMLNSMIESNTRSVNRCHKKIEDIRNEIEEKNRQTEEIINLKCRLMKKFNLRDTPKNTIKIESPKKTNSTSPNCKVIVSNQKRHLESPTAAAAPSRQIIRELRSTIKFLKTPRSSRRSRPSTILTPHSMSFSIKSQFEKLLE